MAFLGNSDQYLYSSEVIKKKVDVLTASTFFFITSDGFLPA